MCVARALLKGCCHCCLAICTQQHTAAALKDDRCDRRSQAKHKLEAQECRTGIRMGQRLHAWYTCISQHVRHKTWPRPVSRPDTSKAFVACMMHRMQMDWSHSHRTFLVTLQAHKVLTILCGTCCSFPHPASSRICPALSCVLWPLSPGLCVPCPGFQ